MMPRYKGRVGMRHQSRPCQRTPASACGKKTLNGVWHTMGLDLSVAVLLAILTSITIAGGL
jgi:hypothetical protein